MTFSTQKVNAKRDINKELVHPDQYVKIWGFMLNDLNLEKTELLVYAIIFSMYKHKADAFSGSRGYLQAWCNAGKSAVDNALMSLERKKLITKEYVQFGQAKKAVYFINTDALPTHEMFENENKYRDINQRLERNEKLRQYGIF